MASDETPRVRANRTNSKRSTGPRSAAGKAKSARNALRHGLSAASFHASAAADANEDDVSQMLRGLAKSVGDLSAGDEAVLMRDRLSRVREVKRSVLEDACQRVEQSGDGAPEPAEEILARALISCAAELLKLDGYERKALSREKRALLHLC